ncbi:MAG: hypothetical protein NVSMB25_07820 [Thermoleophilaceae bacterium]
MRQDVGANLILGEAGCGQCGTPSNSDTCPGKPSSQESGDTAADDSRMRRLILVATVVGTASLPSTPAFATTLPGVTAPSVTVPGIAIPGVTVPGVSTPSVSAPITVSLSPTTAGTTQGAGIPGLGPALTPAQGDPPGLAPPVFGRTFVARPGAGVVRITPPSGGTHVLTRGEDIPAGSTIDARSGEVRLTSASVGPTTQTGAFAGGIFEVRQSSDGFTDLLLRGGDFRRCRSRGTRHNRVARRMRTARHARARLHIRTARHARARPHIRTARHIQATPLIRAGRHIRTGHRRSAARGQGGRESFIRGLWGSDNHGRFRTHGRDSVASVRGTVWLTADRCDGTLIFVREGKVVATDRPGNRSHLLSAGQSQFARRR